jgi:membrane bound O-acyltransferase family protein
VEWSQVTRDALAVSVTVGLSATSGALNAPPAGRRVAAFGVASLTLFTPWLASPASPAVRFLCAGGTALSLLRNLDLLRDTAATTALARAVHLVCTFDTRRVERTTPGIDFRAWLRAVAFALPTALAFGAILHVGAPQTRAEWLARWTAATVAVYFSIEVVVALHHAAAKAVGFTLPTLHADPILSRSLGEFWGKRWNLGVRNMLHEHVFRPLSRRTSRAAAVFATFAASALLHAWLELAAAGPLLALCMAGYFTIEGALVLVESRLRVSSWSPRLQRGWTVCAVILPLPLLLEPLLALTLS